ncbi:MAG: type II secretion system F family protein [candidate division Zixibacteria bacterium]|nr:type II secretion system F family protein [candidate division Zixibacteria bacterium]
MVYYRYWGKDLSGAKAEGLKRAKNPDDLESQLVEEGIFLKSFTRRSIGIITTLHGWSKKPEITHLTRRLAVLISSGIPILEAVQSIKELIDDRRLGAIFDEIISGIEAGESLHAAFGKYPEYFDTIYISLLETGEVSGTLDKSMERIASYRERAETISKKIRAAMAYPSLVLFVSFAVIFALVAYIIPIFSSMYSGFGMELPGLTQKIVGFSDLLKNSIWPVLFILLIIIVSFVGAYPTKRFKLIIGMILLKLPILKRISLKLATARFCRTLGTLLTSGLPLITAIPVAIKTSGNKFIQRRLERVPERLAEGTSLADTLMESKIFPRTVIRMTSVGESTGRLGEMFTRMADFFEAEVDTEITTMTSLIEPIVIIGLGLVIAVILLAMYLPLFDLIAQIGA